MDGVGGWVGWVVCLAGVGGWVGAGRGYRIMCEGEGGVMNGWEGEGRRAGGKVSYGKLFSLFSVIFGR